MSVPTKALMFFNVLFNYFVDTSLSLHHTFIADMAKHSREYHYLHPKLQLLDSIPGDHVPHAPVETC